MKRSSTKLLFSITGNPIYIEWRTSFLGKLCGLMGTRSLDPQSGIVLVENRTGIINTSIHMLFVFTPLAIYWLDDHFSVVHKVVAQPWDLAHASPLPAKYVMELHPIHIDRWQLGDTITFDENH